MLSIEIHHNKQLCLHHLKLDLRILVIQYHRQVIDIFSNIKWSYYLEFKIIINFWIIFDYYFSDNLLIEYSFLTVKSPCKILSSVSLSWVLFCLYHKFQMLRYKLMAYYLFWQHYCPLSFINDCLTHGTRML